MRQVAMRAVGCLMLVGWWAGPAQAVPITFGFTGTVGGVLDNGHHLDGSIVVGGMFSGQYTFESTTPDDYPGDPHYGRYAFPASPQLLMTLHVGNYDITASLDYIVVGDWDKDGYAVAAKEFPFAGLQARMSISYSDENGHTLASDLLPLIPSDVGGFSDRLFQFTIPEQYTVLTSWGGTVESLTLVPEPQTIGLLFVAAGLGIRVRRGSQIVRQHT